MMQRLTGWGTLHRPQHRRRADDRLKLLAEIRNRGHADHGENCPITDILNEEEIKKIMTPTHVDTFVLTFNSAKEVVDSDVFGTHLCNAFKKNATSLPELVVFSLQEIAPLAYAFIGGYFLSSYLDKFTAALNFATAKYNDDNAGLLAAARLRDEDDGDQDYSATKQQQYATEPRQYTLIKTANVGMTAIMVFALDPASIEGLQAAETSFGTQDIGNKGAVGLRFLYSTGPEGGEMLRLGGTGGACEGRLGLGGGVRVERRETEFTFVAAHLAAMEWNLKVRNENWRSIMAGLLFEDPRDILPEDQVKVKGAGQGEMDGGGEGRGEEDTRPLLARDDDDKSSNADEAAVLQQYTSLSPRDQKRLHDSTIFKPTTHLFVAGDLNYRISEKGPGPEPSFPRLDPESEHHHPHFFAARDQLRKEMAEGRTLHGMSEAGVKFPPTYKYDILTEGQKDLADEECGGGMDEGNQHLHNENEVIGEKVWWRWAKHRWPSWCDRVLFRECPRGWLNGGGQGQAQERQAQGGQLEDDDEGGGEEGGIDPIAYNALPVVSFSDHRAVFLRANVPLVTPKKITERLEELAGLEEGEFDGGEGELDGPGNTRVRLPVPVDRTAWSRRDMARKKEMLLGWSMILWGTKEGAVVLVGGVTIVAGGWFLGGKFWG